LATKKGKQASGTRFVAAQRWMLMDYFDPDDPDAPPLTCEVRKDLSFGEANTLSFDTEANPPMPEIWDKLAPFVRDWNLDDADGNAITAPAAGGGGQFNYLPMAMFWKIWNDLKWRSSGAVDSKRSGSLEPAVVTVADAS